MDTVFCNTHLIKSLGIAAEHTHIVAASWSHLFLEVIPKSTYRHRVFWTKVQRLIKRIVVHWVIIFAGHDRNIKVDLGLPAPGLQEASVIDRHSPLFSWHQETRSLAAGQYLDGIVKALRFIRCPEAGRHD